jgi:NAD(P)H-dependent FMN reductase
LPGPLLKLAVVVGSVRQARFGPLPAQWFAEEAQRHGSFDVEVVDLADTLLPLSLGPEPPAMATYDPRPAEMADLTRSLAAADAFVIITPEYNHSFPASVKSLIDWHYTEWRSKPIGFVSYGGEGAGLRAVEHLRLVFAELYAMTVRSTVSFRNYWEAFGPDSRPVDAAGSGEAAGEMLDQLAWWASALRSARRDSPLAAAA